MTYYVCMRIGCERTFACVRVHTFVCAYACLCVSERRVCEHVLGVE
jgi:hypothetical protein